MGRERARPERVSRKTSGRTCIPLLYYSYHVMVGLGTIFIAVLLLAALLLWRGKLYASRCDAVAAAALRSRFPTSPTPPDG